MHREVGRSGWTQKGGQEKKRVTGKQAILYVRWRIVGRSAGWKPKRGQMEKGRGHGITRDISKGEPVFRFRIRNGSVFSGLLDLDPYSEYGIGFWRLKKDQEVYLY